MAKLQTMESVVLSVLEEEPTARKDDCVLFYYVCARLNKFGLLKTKLADALLLHKNYGMPSWETVTRCRRKIQAQRPDLVDTETAKIRLNEEKEYIDYARE